jgi:hypothetical protein
MMGLTVMRPRRSWTRPCECARYLVFGAQNLTDATVTRAQIPLEKTCMRLEATGICPWDLVIKMTASFPSESISNALTT